MNKETVVKEVIEILSTSNYIDTSEDLYDGLKQIKREITLNTVHDFLWALESSTVIDVDGKVSECSEKIKSLLECMNNERYNQIINEAYKNYRLERNFQINQGVDILSQEEFINKIKTDVEFSEKWGLKIEERELSLEERRKLADYESEFVSPMTVESWDRNNIPTKLITITYKDEKIEVYE